MPGNPEEIREALSDLRDQVRDGTFPPSEYGAATARHIVALNNAKSRKRFALM